MVRGKTGLTRLFFAIVLLVSAALAQSAGAADEIDIDGVPLPADAKPIDAGASSSPFAGTWTGSWDGVVKTILIIEAIDEKGSAEVVYAIGGNPAFNLPHAWRRYKATVSNNVLTVHGRAPIAYRLSQTGRLKATYGKDMAFAILSPVSFDDIVAAPDTASWSPGKSIRLKTDLVENGQAIELESVIYKPAGEGPFPLAVVSHGSTGYGTGAIPFTQTWTNDWFAEFLNERGFLVAFPQRRGRGKSDGLYDEGFHDDRSNGYTCAVETTLRGADRAVTDLEAAIASLRERPDVKEGPVVLAGMSRGGALSIAYAGKHPEQVRGVINFVGGWLGGCDTAQTVNQELLGRGGSFPRPTLWIYGEDDTFYSIGESRDIFEAFRSAGGTGEFFKKKVRGDNNGHWVMSVPPLWTEEVSRYLDALAK